MWNMECGTLNVGAKEGQRLKKESRVERVRER